MSERRCIFRPCVATWRHWHGGFPGGYDNPDDPEGMPLIFEGDDPEPDAVRDHNGAALPPAHPEHRQAVPDDDTDDAFDFHIVRVEVNVAAVIQEPDGSILGRNMVDATLAFGWRMGPPPDGISDAKVNAALTKQLSPVLAVIQTALTFQGWVAMGQVDEPMKDNGTTVGLGLSSPVTVRVSFPDEGAAIHD